MDPILTNREIVDYLYRCGYNTPETIVKDLIEGGYVEEETLTIPEQMAEAARNWVSNGSDPKVVFHLAKGWSTHSWEYVLDRDLKHPENISQVFDALVILAKRAGIEL